MELAVLAFIAVFLMVSSGVLFVMYRRDVRSRLANVVSGRGGVDQDTLQAILKAPENRPIDKVMDPFQKVLPRSAEEVSIVQKRLIWAGYRKDSYVNIFYGVKVILPVVLTVLVTVTGVYEKRAFFVYAMALGLGFLLPDFWLGNRINARQEKIRLALPEALDLMVICLEAGLGLDQTVLRVADEMELTTPELAEEFQLVNLEQRAGRPRAEAWRNLAERTDVESVRSLVAMLLQADQFGTSLANSLRVHADGLRTLRRQQAEEQAAKTTVKLVFPLVLFIFPSLFVVTLGPSLLVIRDAFEKYFGQQ